MFDVNIIRKDRGARLGKINLSFKDGEFVLLTGPSGTGKTTLLKCIAGLTSYNGSVTIQRDDRLRSVTSSKAEIGYIGQYPALNPYERVERAIYWCARASFPVLPESTIEDMVRKNLSRVGLSAFSDRQIRRLSGGQQKRASIAAELVREKHILLGDEIDSGLDAAIGRYLLSILREVVHEENKIGIIVSHSLTNMRLYDRLVLLAADPSDKGRCHVVYDGPPEKAPSYFDVDEKSLTESMIKILGLLTPVEDGGEGNTEFFIEKYEITKKKGVIRT